MTTKLHSVLWSPRLKLLCNRCTSHIEYFYRLNKDRGRYPKFSYMYKNLLTMTNTEYELVKLV